MEGFLRPRFLLVFRNIFRLDRHVKQIASLQGNDEVLEFFLRLGVQHAVLLKQGEKGGHGALVLDVGRKGPAFRQVARDVSCQAPVVRFLDFVVVAPGPDGVVVFHAQIGCDHLSAPAHLR